MRFTLYPIALLISAVFLAATLATGWLLPASHHVLHWRCQTHHVACLMLGDVLMAVIQLSGDSLIQGGGCKAIGKFSYFFMKQIKYFVFLNGYIYAVEETFSPLVKISHLHSANVICYFYKIFFKFENILCIKLKNVFTLIYTEEENNTYRYIKFVWKWGFLPPPQKFYKSFLETFLFCFAHCLSH